MVDELILRHRSNSSPPYETMTQNTTDIDLVEHIASVFHLPPLVLPAEHKISNTDEGN